MLFFLRFAREAVVFSVGEILPLRCFFVVRYKFKISLYSEWLYFDADMDCFVNDATLPAKAHCKEQMGACQSCRIT